MIKGIRLDNYHNNTHAEMVELTGNTIIVCENYDVKEKIRAYFYELSEELNFDVVSNKVWYETSDDVSIINEVSFLPTTFYSVRFKNQTIQRFYVTVEASSILSIITKEDLWFATNEEIYPLTGFNQLVSDDGVEVYKNFTQGRYGAYTGECLARYEKGEN